MSDEYIFWLLLRYKICGHEYAVEELTQNPSSTCNEISAQGLTKHFLIPRG